MRPFGSGAQLKKRSWRISKPQRPVHLYYGSTTSMRKLLCSVMPLKQALVLVSCKMVSRLHMPHVHWRLWKYSYAQIEKELLAIVFACTHFEQYIYRRDVVQVETDHQPLVSIVLKPLNSAPSQLQKMLLRLQKYNLHMMYKRGKDMFLADTPFGHRRLQIYNHIAYLLLIFIIKVF